MRQAGFRKFVSSLMVAVLLTLSVTGFCRSAHALEISGGEPAGCSAAEKSCPCSPSHEDGTTDHCGACCNCPCHAPLSAQPVRLTTSQLMVPLHLHESFTYLPEVVLPKFIPPQNRA